MNKITSIEVQKRNKKRVNVFVDDEYSFACDAELIYRYSLKKDEQVDLEKIKAIIGEEEFIKCKNSALRIIEKSYKTEKEIREKLVTKGYEEKPIKQAVEFLKEYNFLNDKAYAELYIKDKISTQGKNKIYYNLLKKGVSEEVLKGIIENTDNEMENNGAYKLCKKKYDSLVKTEADKYKISQKLFRFMASKGYDFELINRLIKQITNNDQFME